MKIAKARLGTPRAAHPATTYRQEKSSNSNLIFQIDNIQMKENSIKSPIKAVAILTAFAILTYGVLAAMPLTPGMT